MSVRKIPIQTRSVPGYLYSHKNNRLIQCESRLEKKFFLTLEFEDDIVSYEEQPLKVDRYIPDALVKRERSKDLLVEVKYSKEVDDPDEKLSEKFETLQSYCLQNNLEFKIFTEKDVTEPYFSNISLIYHYAPLKVSKKDIHQIYEVIDSFGELAQLRDLINKGCDVSIIYAMVYRKLLDLNLYTKITNKTIVRIPR